MNRVVDFLSIKVVGSAVKGKAAADAVLIWIALCNLCVLCDSVVVVTCNPITTETQRLHREELKIKTLNSRLKPSHFRFKWFILCLHK